MAFTETYDTNRRGGKSTKNKRKGPVLEEDASSGEKSQTLGALSIQSHSPSSEENGGKKTGLAGSKELLAYFYRLSRSDAQNELVDVQYIKALLDGGADINVTDRYGQTILHAAVRDWHPDVARFLIENKAEVNKQDNFGRSPIFIAASLDYPEMIQFLANKGADININTYGENQTPLHYAARNEAISSIKCLIKLGANLSAKDYKGRVPLYVAVQQGCEDAAQCLLDIGCPAAILDRCGVSALEIMIEKMPAIAHKALSQYLYVDKVNGTKEYFLGALEPKDAAESSGKNGRTALELIVKFNELDLLCHPVIQRLMNVKWNYYGYRSALMYLLVNILYITLWSTLAIITTTSIYAFDFKEGNYWKIGLAFLALALALLFLIEQTTRARMNQRSDQAWRAMKIEDLNQDLVYCHPQWPHENEALISQITAYSNQVGDAYKNLWNYLEWLTALAIITLFILKGAHYFFHNENLHLAFHVCMTVVILLTWVRFLKACKAFQICGQFISILGSALVAVAQFAFLFMIFFIPFVVAFWVFFGGVENAEIIGKKVSPSLVDAFRNFNDVVYTVWTLTLVIGFPMSAIKAIDKTIALVYVSIYYFVMSVVCLNLFIALLSQVFGQKYNQASKYALLEQAKSILASRAMLTARNKNKLARFLQDKCNPLTERLGFRESQLEPDELEEIKHNTIEAIKQETQHLTKNFNHRFDRSSTNNLRLNVKKLQQEFFMIERNQNDYEMTLATLERIKVENKKVKKIIGKVLE